MGPVDLIHPGWLCIQTQQLGAQTPFFLHDDNKDILNPHPHSKL